MGGKKKAAAAAGGEDEQDLSTEQFYKAYRKNVTMLGIEVSKRIVQQYNEDWLEDQKHYEKVSFQHLIGNRRDLAAYLGRSRLVTLSSLGGRHDSRQLQALYQHPALERPLLGRGASLDLPAT